MKDIIYEALLALRTTYFIEISEKNSDLETFTVGWIDKRVLKLKRVKL